MFKKPYLMTTLLIAMLVLAACGTTADESGEADIDNNTGEAPIEEVETTDETEDTQDEPKSDESEEGKNASENEETNKEETNEEQETNDTLANAEKVDSDAQEFSMYVLPEFTLTSEEPGRDSLYLTEDGQIFMRIETLPADEENYEYLKENTISTLEATSGADNTPNELTDENALPQGDQIENAVGYTVTTAEGTTTGIVFKRDDLLVRLMIFDTPEGDYVADFLQMGETVTKK